MPRLEPPTLQARIATAILDLPLALVTFGCWATRLVFRHSGPPPPIGNSLDRTAGRPAAVARRYSDLDYEDSVVFPNSSDKKII
jgi:hypothetical protein